MKLTEADRGTANARTASHFRRLQTASSPSRPDPFRVSSAIVWSLSASRALRHQDDVAVLEVEVLLLSGESVVVERNPLHRSSLGVEDDNARACGELREPAGQRERVQHGR